VNLNPAKLLSYAGLNPLASFYSAALLAKVSGPKKLPGPVTKAVQTKMGAEGDLPAPSQNETYAWAALSTVSMAASTYHGYRRNKSVAWALWWGLMGALFPVVTPVVALAQGYGKKR
jgi:hypothetical protein